jgi:flagellar basal-body rod protein FlgB
MIMAVSTIRLLENLIDFCSLKNKVISKNIANIGTEGYKRENVEFKSLLTEINAGLKATNKNHIKAGISAGPPYEIQQDKGGEMLSGINNVDIDKEMSELAENTLRFKFAARKIGDYYKGIQNVIKGGGR